MGGDKEEGVWLIQIFLSFSSKGGNGGEGKKRRRIGSWLISVERQDICQIWPWLDEEEEI